jgi:hypothetical protein
MMLRFFLSRFCLVLALIAVFSLAGTSTAADKEKLTKDNYEKIKEGMTVKEVVELIGKPDHSVDTGDIKLSDWKAGKIKVAITFEKGKVKLKIAEGFN